MPSSTQHSARLQHFLEPLQLSVEVQDGVEQFHASLLRANMYHRQQLKEVFFGCIFILKQLDARGALALLIRQRPSLSDDDICPLSDWDDSRKTAFLTALFRASWSAETCLEFYRREWNATLPERGQSAVSALLLQDLFGGEIHKFCIEGHGVHFVLKEDAQKILDVTGTHFRNNIQMLPDGVVTRESLLQPSFRFIWSVDVKVRYELLKVRFIQATFAMGLAALAM